MFLFFCPAVLSKVIQEYVSEQLFFITFSLVTSRSIRPFNPWTPLPLSCCLQHPQDPPVEINAPKFLLDATPTLCTTSNFRNPYIFYCRKLELCTFFFLQTWHISITEKSFLLDPCLTEGPIKSLLSMSVHQFGIFPRNGYLCVSPLVLHFFKEWVISFFLFLHNC